MLTPGHKLDRYELLCPIASGGMATVWLARMRGKRGFEKLVAIKTIKTELVTDASYTQMFLDEARIASRIHHPNVAQILDLGEEDDNLYLVMEYVDGDSLAKTFRLAAKKKKPFPLEHGLRVIADACAGLHAAHELKDDAGTTLGVVHRDVSPQNILVTANGSAKVIDFGLAKAAQRDAPDTQEGIVKGKIRYLSPEYVTQKGIDRRADIWALGICLYEIAVGHPPFDELSDLEVVRRIASDAPAPRLDDERIPSALRVVLKRALAVDPNDRFATAAAMRRSIEEALLSMGKSPSAEDVGEFIAEVLPELAERRKRTVNKVMDVVMSRTQESMLPGGSGSQPSPSNGDIKIPSVPPPSKVPKDLMGAIPPAPESEAVPLRRKKSSNPPPPEEIKSTAATTTRLAEQLGSRRKVPVAPLFVVVSAALASFALFVWPGKEVLLGKADAPASSESVNGLVQPPPPSASTPAPPPPPPTVIDLNAPADSSSASSSSNPPPRASGSTSAVHSAGGVTPTTSASAAVDAGRPKWNYRPDNWQESPSDPAAAAAAAASAEKILKATPTVTPPTTAPPPTASPTATTPGP